MLQLVLPLAHPHASFLRIECCESPQDLWSLGITLAELYTGRGFLRAASRGGLAVELAQLFGQPPAALFADGKYASELLPLVAHTEQVAHLVEFRLATLTHACISTLTFIVILSQRPYSTC